METKIIYRTPLGNPNRKYRQDRLMITTFKAYMTNLRLGIEHCKELGFDWLEFCWVNPSESRKCMVACEEVGIDGVYQNWDAFGGAAENLGTKEIRPEKVQQYLEEIKQYRHVVGHYVWDEPLHKETMEGVRQLVDMMESMDPGRIPYTVALPGVNSYGRNWEQSCYEEYLREYAEIIDPPVVSLDHYPFKPGTPEPPDQLDSSLMFLDLAVLRQLALERKSPMWYYFQSQDDPWTGSYWKLTPEQVRMQQYMALLHGAVGLQNYNVRPGALNMDGTKGPLFYTTKELNHNTHMLGKTFMALTSVAVFHSPEVLKDSEHFAKYRTALSESEILAGEELPYRCSAGEFVDSQSNRYLFIQNRDYREARKFRLQLKESYRIYEVSREDGLQRVKFPSKDVLELSLAPGDAVLLRFQNPEEEPYLIDYVLDK